MMIFIDPEINDSDDIFSLGDYYSVNDSRFSADTHSKATLNIKYKHDEDADPQAWKQQNKTIALGNFRPRLDSMLSRDIAIAVVPPHGLSSSHSGSPSGIQELGRLLAVKPPYRSDRVPRSSYGDR
jgi:hypothetical protein